MTINDRRLLLASFFGDANPAPATIAAANRVLATVRVRRPPSGSVPLRVTRIPVGRFPSTVAVADGAVWIGTGAGVTRIDPDTNQVVARLRLGHVGGEGPCGVAAGPAGVWVSRGFPGEVLRIDPATNRVVARLVVPGAGCLAVGERLVWVATRRAVRTIDPRTNRLSGPPIAVRGRAQGIAIGPRGVWVASGFGDGRAQRSLPRSAGRPVGVVTRIDVATRRVAIARPLPRFPEHVVAGAGQVWVTSNDGTVARLNPDTGAEIRRTRVAAGGRTRLAVGLGSLWATNVVGPGGDHRITRRGLLAREGFSSIAAGVSPVALVIGEGAVWVADYNGATVTRIDP